MKKGILNILTLAFIPLFMWYQTIQLTTVHYHRTADNRIIMHAHPISTKSNPNTNHSHPLNYALLLSGITINTIILSVKITFDEEHFSYKYFIEIIFAESPHHKNTPLTNNFRGPPIAA